MDYFDLESDSLYMLFVAQVNKKHRKTPGDAVSTSHDMRSKLSQLRSMSICRIMMRLIFYVTPCTRFV